MLADVKRDGVAECLLLNVGLIRTPGDLAMPNVFVFASNVANC